MNHDTNRLDAVATLLISQSPEVLFDAWLNPVTARRFWFATPTGQMKTVEIDPVVGGAFRIVEQRGANEANHSGRFLELQRPSRIVFEFQVAEDHPMTRVQVAIAAADAVSRVTITHTLDPAWADFVEKSREGWTKMLAALQQAVVE